MKRPRHQQLILNCLTGTQDSAYIRRVRQSEKFLRAASREFELHAHYQMAYLFKEPTLEPSCRNHYSVSKADLITLYEQKLVQNKSGRALYQKIKDTAPNGLCQLCHLGIAETLDHYLPKEHFPSLSIAPFNLIPACLRCNKEKHATRPRTEDEQTIHPHFDAAFYRRDWLRAEIDPLTGVVSYSAHPDLKNPIFTRVETHLSAHGIGNLYSKMATAEVVQWARLLNNTQFPLRPADAYEEMNEQYHRLARWRQDGSLTIKAWEVALYKGLLQADWFINGGYRRILSSYQDRERNLTFEEAVTAL